MRKGELTFELVPQGTLVERLRAAGAGIAAVYTPTGLDTPIADGKEVRYFDGKPYLLETALPVDYAFIAGTGRTDSATWSSAAPTSTSGPASPRRPGWPSWRSTRSSNRARSRRSGSGCPASSSRASSARPWSTRCPSTVPCAATRTFRAPTTASRPGRAGRWRNWPHRCCPKARTSISASAYRATCPRTPAAAPHPARRERDPRLRRDRARRPDVPGRLQRERVPRHPEPGHLLLRQRDRLRDGAGRPGGRRSSSAPTR